MLDAGAHAHYRRPFLAVGAHAMRLRQIVVAASLAACAHAASAFGGLFVFGDSLSDSGNDAILVGSNPSQVITGNTYIPSQPYASGQFTNGNVWAVDLAQLLGLAPYAAPSLAGGGDFAFGGARVATDGSGLPPSLTTQVGQFLGAVSGVAPSNALYVIAGGGNDARAALGAIAGGADPSTVIGAAAAAYAAATGSLIDELQAAGAQRIVVWDVPDVGKVPSVTALGPSASFLGTLLASSMNTALDARLAIETPGVSLFDIFGLQDELIADPGAFGLVNATDACGAPSNACDPATALFWDGLHPTDTGHDLIAAAIAAQVPEPSQVALMFSGLALLGWRLRRARVALAG
jgi:outer membrane lipase/esterase